MLFKLTLNLFASRIRFKEELLERTSVIENGIFASLINCQILDNRKSAVYSIADESIGLSIP